MEESQYMFFIAYVLLCAVVAVALIKVQSTESLTITTQEFKTFQFNFLVGYMVVILGEVLCVASFFYVLVSLHMSLDQITKLYIVSVASSTFFSVLSEVVDVGSRRDKCILSAILYAIATFSLFSGGHYEILLLGRVVYGGGNVLLHSAFDAYMVHEHTTQGFPDDWLLHTFSKLAHAMTMVAIVAGAVGQSSVSVFGPYGCVGLSCLLFVGIALFIGGKWNKDTSGSRFMLSSFSMSIGQTMRALRGSSQMLLVIALSACAEASILIFTFYWAPWIASSCATGAPSGAPVLSETLDTSVDSSGSSHSGNSEGANGPGGAVAAAVAAVGARLLGEAPDDMQPFHETNVPYILIYSTLMMSAMLGNYLYTLASPSYGNESIFQVVLGTSAAAYFLSGIVHTPLMVFGASIVIQICSGGYWPCIGFLRGRFFLSEIRGTTMALTRVLSLVIVITVLWIFHDSFFMVLMCCSCLNAVSVYIQFHVAQTELKGTGDGDDFDELLPEE